MKDRTKLELEKEVEWLSTWYDHFRHVYNFVQSLYRALKTRHVDYDTRTREVINKSNFTKKKQELKSMIEILSNIKKNSEITITAQRTYPHFKTITSLQREFLSILNHEESHYHYLIIEEKENQFEKNNNYKTKEKSTVDLEAIQTIRQDIKQDITRYECIPDIFLSDSIKNEYTTIMNKIKQLDQYNTDDILIFKNTITSVSNEYYKIEEELVHLLYDIRLYLKDNQQEFFMKLIDKDSNFWIARSTINSLASYQS